MSRLSVVSIVTMSDITATLWFLLVAAAVGVRAQGEVFFFNEEMDGFFSQFREDIRHANNSQFPLPDIQLIYNKKLLFLNLRGEWNGTSGTLRDMATVKRTSNATIVTSKDNFVFRAEFGFEDLKISYKYSYKFLGITLKGDMDLTIDNNSIYVELLVNLTENRCSGNVISIKNLRFTVLDKISVRVTGFSLANSLVSYWLSHSVNDVSAGITTPIELGLKNFLRANIKQFDFCKFGAVPEHVPFDDMDSSDDLTRELTDTTYKEANAILS